MKQFGLGVLVGMLVLFLIGIAGGDEPFSDLCRDIRHAIGWKKNIERPVKKGVDRAEKKVKDWTEDAADKIDETVDDIREGGSD